MIEIKNLVKSYGNYQALKEVSFQVEEGQIVGLLGPNGAGKSTTMNILTGYLGASSGSIFVDGLDIEINPDGVKKRIGYLPEIPPLYLDMTVKEYLHFTGELKGVKKPNLMEEVTRVMEAVNVDDKQNRLIKHLSKGYKQRVGICGALMGNPPILILDEPTVGLDPSQIIEIRQLIKKLGEQHTVILSSHILSEVSAICDHIIIIDKGELIAQGSPKQLSEQFTKQNLIRIKAKASSEQVMEVLDGLTCLIDNYHIMEEGDDGIILIEATANTKEDIREEVFFEFANHAVPVYELARENLSLEEVFLKLTQEEETVSC